MDHQKIVETKGARTIAIRLNVPVGRVRVWKARKTIPRSAWAELIDAFPDVTLDMLKAGAPQ